MIRKATPLLSLFLLFTSYVLAQTLRDPDEFLGYPLGDRFTPHHRIVDYYEHVAQANDNVKLIPYGETYEHRPLMVAVITSPENFGKLEAIRQDNLKRAGVLDGQPENDVVMVWMSYNVHGNESVTSEAAIQTLYELANASNSRTQNWLQNTVVILDPCINPDGRDRYANFYRQYGNKVPNPNLDSKEHHEPWPGGRANHYFFDLNRDWAWQSQQESKGRIALYHQWLPQVHVDFHEQYLDNPYYFAPAAEPFHEVITEWQREFQDIIGKNNAKYFDEQGWLYFTKERFDLLYPSYGDTYPTYNGAIGMTYEKGGGGWAGLAGMMENGDTVTLKDRILHHHTTGLSTVEITSLNSDRVLKEFTAYFDRATSNPSGQYKSYVVSRTNGRDKLKRLSEWLDTHQIQYGTASSSRSLNGFDYVGQANRSFSLNANDLVINTTQPKANLVKVFFEPKTVVSDSVTYDITAWNIPYALGLAGYALTQNLNVSVGYDLPPVPSPANQSNVYAYLFEYNDKSDVHFLAQLMKKKVKVRATEKSLTMEGKTFKPGSLVVLSWDNEHHASFDETVMSTAKTLEQTIYPVSTGYAERGIDLGSGSVKFLEAPKVALLGGEGTSPYAFGETWYYFEQVIDYPVSVIGTDYFNEIDLWQYNVLIAPEGGYGSFDEDLLVMIQRWIGDGGKLILTGTSIEAIHGADGFGIAMKESEDDADALQAYGDRERDYISNLIPGAIFKVQIDNTHPLGYGLPDYYYSLKRSATSYQYLADGWNVGVVSHSNGPVNGFAGYRAQKQVGESLTFGVEEQGNGSIVYLVDNPLFRGFWHNGHHLFGNALFMVD